MCYQTYYHVLLIKFEIVFRHIPYPCLYFTFPPPIPEFSLKGH